MRETFIDAHRATLGVEPSARSCLPIVYYERKARIRDLQRQPARVRRNAATLVEHIARVWGHREVYGVRKIWKQLRREGVAVARCTVARPMRRGLPSRTPRPRDLVTRQFTATRPNPLWVADPTYVATWRGFVYVAFVIDVFSWRIVGWRASNSLRSDFDALEQAFYARRSPGRTGWCIRAIAASNIWRFAARSAWPRPGWTCRSGAPGIRTQMRLAETVSPCSRRRRSSTRALEGPGGRRVHGPRGGRVVRRGAAYLNRSATSRRPSSSRPITTGRRS